MNDDDCCHGLMPGTCSICRHGPQLRGWHDPNAKRPWFPRKGATKGERKGSMIGSSGRPHDARLLDRGGAPLSVDRRRSQRAKTPGQYGSGPKARVTRGARSRPDFHVSGVPKPY